VNDVLDVSKIESGKMMIEERPFHIDHLISGVIHMFQDVAKSKKIYLDVEKIHVPNQLIGDVLRIRQILVNLVSNAIKFTDQGGVSIVINSETIVGSTRINLSIKVKDTGIGMTSEQQQRLFEDYTQAKRSITRLFGGTGLGLSISQKLAHLMHGEITAYGKPNEGSTFILNIPVGIVEPDQHDLSLEQHPEELKLRPGSRVLISEDNHLSLKLASRILTNFGMIVDGVSNGRIAYDHALKNQYELIILDLETPEMNGKEAAFNIRKFNTKTPILALTAHQKSDIETECIQAGMNDVIQKPIDPKSLHKALIKWLPLY
jgi:CheY-like chemotaxis protein